jgi:hypothetical protein
MIKLNIYACAIVDTVVLLSLLRHTLSEPDQWTLIHLLRPNLAGLNRRPDGRMDAPPKPMRRRATMCPIAGDAPKMLAALGYLQVGGGRVFERDKAKEKKKKKKKKVQDSIRFDIDSSTPPPNRISTWCGAARRTVRSAGSSAL